VRGHKNQQQAHQAYKIVVVEVVGKVNELGIGKRQEKYYGGDTVGSPAQQHDADGSQDHEKMHSIEGFARKGLHPAKPPVLEVKNGLDIMIFNPPQRHEADRAKDHQQPENQSETDKRRC